MRTLIVYLLLLVMIILPIDASSLPAIDSQTGTITLTEPMHAALHQFNPRFMVWNRDDYAPTIVRQIEEENMPGLPFTVICDANQDDVPDVILDGHDGVKSLLVALVSIGKEYRAILIQENEEQDPSLIENEFEGKKEKGFSTYLSPVNDDKETVYRVEVFLRVYPQQSNKDGKLLNDGGFVEFSFWDGRFFVSGEFVA